MKKAIEWLDEVGETVAMSAFAGKTPPGIEVENLIRRIQSDALEHACGLVTVNQDEPEKAFTSIFRLMLELKAGTIGCVSGNQTAFTLLKESEQAIDGLLIFCHQHTKTPLECEMALLKRIRKFLAPT